MRSSSYLNVQAHILDLKGGPLADVDIYELGRVLVKNIYMSKAIEQQLLADGRGETREHGSHGCGGER